MPRQSQKATSTPPSSVGDSASSGAKGRQSLPLSKWPETGERGHPFSLTQPPPGVAPERKEHTMPLPGPSCGQESGSARGHGPLTAALPKGLLEPKSPREHGGDVKRRVCPGSRVSCG